MKIQAENFSTGYDRVEVLHHIIFLIEKPGIYVVLGKNGAGKTTLFRALTGMLRPFTGSITFDDIPQPESRVGIAYLSHKNSIPAGLTVRDAMKFFGRIEGVTDGNVTNIINKFNLTELLDKRVQSLSQGQRKRVSLAKSLIGNKSVMILDEPTANLDPKVSEEIRNLIRVQSRDSIVLYSSHNLYEAMDLGTEVIALNSGNLVYSGKIEGLKTDSYTIGIRGKGIENLATNYTIDGKYLVFKLNSPTEAAELISKLTAAGAMIYEVKEMGNPLERFFNDTS
ncbi:MAG: ABC transporter ATP-binding protein [Candidatus Thermoplasmatota archaeon]|nr:ABC transporter ATP-binding protein [Candidatus Thermoplasmatota archaeon]